MSVSAKAPNGQVWHLYASDETPTLTPILNPARSLILDTVYEDIHFLSTNKTAARRWVVDNDGVFTLRTIEVPYGVVEYVEFLTPAGVPWVVGLNDDGTLYTEIFTSAVPKNRRLVTTVMHKGTMVWVADNRMPIPGRG
jgi:hypothetical protein